MAMRLNRRLNISTTHRADSTVDELSFVANLIVGENPPNRTTRLSYDLERYPVVIINWLLAIVILAGLELSKSCLVVIFGSKNVYKSSAKPALQYAHTDEEARLYSNGGADAGLGERRHSRPMPLAGVYTLTRKTVGPHKSNSPVACAGTRNEAVTAYRMISSCHCAVAAHG
jgi:hypothetical protein